MEELKASADLCLPEEFKPPVNLTPLLRYTGLGPWRGLIA